METSKEAIRMYLEHVALSTPQIYKNLCMIPVLGPDSGSAEYLLLDEALGRHLLEVTEVSHGGSVPELKVVNKADTSVLLLDGEELVGAKQNRILNTTILVAQKTVTVIPVSCVEQGRWSYRSPEFFSERRVMASSLRAEKALQVNCSLSAHSSYAGDQGAIWDGIAEKAARRRSVSATMAMSDLYEKDRGSLEEYRSHFKPLEQQIGALFIINGRIAGLDGFATRETFEKVFAKLLDSYAVDAVDWYEGRPCETLPDETLRSFLRTIQTAPKERRPGISLGTDIRFETEEAVGFALEHEARILHLSAFARQSAENRGRTVRMRRYSLRRSGRVS